MQPKTILVCLTSAEHADDLLKQAVPLARRTNAHLIGLHTLEALLVYPGIAMHIPDGAFAAFNKNQREEAEKIRETFERHVQAEVFPSEFRQLRAEAATAGERMVESARAADLVIMAQDDRDVDRWDQRNVTVQVIRECGRPVLVIPTGYDGPEIGSNIVLGWSDTREAARAAHDLLGLTAPGASLTVLRVEQTTRDALRDSDGIDLAEALSRHDVSVSLETRSPEGLGAIADVLAKVAFEKGADLLVTGALGHSRAYDFVLGATTFALLEKMELPVLFSK